MTLVELCEPLFQFVCRLNRSGRKGGKLEMATAIAEVKEIFATMSSKCSGDARLAAQYRKLELPLQGFVDSMVRRSAVSWAGDWPLVSGDLAIEERFFDLLEENLVDPGEEATERLAVFYTCIGLGFTGWYTGQPEFLRRKMMELSARLRGMIDKDTTAKICAEAYKADESILYERAGTTLVGAVIALVGLTVTLLVVNVVLYYAGASDLTRELDKIVTHERSLLPGGKVGS